MIGAIQDANYVPSIYLYKPSASLSIQSDISKAVDIPTRLAKSNKSFGHKPVWQGRIMGGEVADKVYSPEKGSFTSWPFMQQLVIDGYLCSSEHVDENGKCSFDRSTIVETVLNTTPESSNDNNSKNVAASPTVSGECPICKYMKGGPCKDVFTTMEDCMDKFQEDSKNSESLPPKSVCLDETLKLMGCMRQSEYYDVMTANIGTKYDAMVEASEKLQSHNEEKGDTTAAGDIKSERSSS
jgi:hypothetical protein